MDAEYGWKQWNEGEHFTECEEENSFTFTLKPGAKVLLIYSKGCLANLPVVKDEFSFDGWTQLDFEELLRQGYDAVELPDIYAPGLYMELYGWDCDSILIMNPDIIEVIE